MPRHCRSVSALMTLAAGASVCAALFAAPLVTASFTPASAQTTATVSVEFRTALTPYGTWHRHSRWGEVWVPAHVDAGWRPYTVGHWIYSDDYGWYWVSDTAEADWGWIVFHYGRWVLDLDLGWCWVAGRDWGPAFVDWRRGRDYVGWAPMPPDEVVVEVRDDPQYWDFVRVTDFLAPRIATVIVPAREREVLIRDTVVENRTIVYSDRSFAVNPGIAPAVIAAATRVPLHTYQVRPMVLAGTASIPGAVTVRADELRQRNVVAERQTAIRETNNIVEPTRNVPPPQALAPHENGRLGANPPRAARGTPPTTTGAAPNQAAPPAAQTRRPGQPGAAGRQQGTAPTAGPSTTTGQRQQRRQAPATTGQAPQQPNAGPEPPRQQGAREHGTPSATQRRGQTPTTTGQAPKQPNAGAEQRRGRGAAEHAAPQRGQRPATTGQAPQQPNAGRHEQRPNAQERGGPHPQASPSRAGPQGANERSLRRPETSGAATPSARELNRGAPQGHRGPAGMERRGMPQATTPHERAAPSPGARPESPGMRGGPQHMPGPAARGPGPGPQGPAHGPAPSTMGAGPRGGPGGPGGPHGGGAGMPHGGGPGGPHGGGGPGGPHQERH
jgi:hypothetical protein